MDTLEDLVALEKMLTHVCSALFAQRAPEARPVHPEQWDPPAFPDRMATMVQMESQDNPEPPAVWDRLAIRALTVRDGTLIHTPT